MRLRGRALTTTSFLATSLLSLFLLARGSLAGQPVLVPATITLLLVVLCWWLNASSPPRTLLLLASNGLILLAAIGGAYGLASRGFAGVTYDTYLHILGGFVTSLLLARYFTARRSPAPLLRSATVTTLLGLGVELLELLVLASSPFPALPARQPLLEAYALDTLKDLLNNALGLLFALTSLSLSKKR